MLFDCEPMTRETVTLINPVTLAFLGDAVFALYVRERLVKKGGGKAADFQRASAKILSAKAQSAFLEKVQPLFTEEENDVFRRGRNAKKPTKSKNAAPGEYNRSTGLEAVIGYLYLIGANDRLEVLFNELDENLFVAERLATGFKPSH